MEKLQNTSAPDRFLDFLNQAYRIPFESGALEELLSSATDCLLYSEQNNLPSGDIGNITDLSNKHSNHNDRLEKIFAAHTLEPLIDPTANWSKQHAVGNIIVDLSKGICFGNSVAQEYLAQDLPQPINKLNLTAKTLQGLVSLLDAKAAAEELGPDRLVQITNQTEATRIPARISFSHTNRGPIAEITFFLFSWDLASLTEFRDQFDLTKTETIVLALILNGKSQNEIAEERSRSLDTIKVQVRALLKKTHCTKSTELVRQVMGYQILRLALESNVNNSKTAHEIPMHPTHSDQTIFFEGRKLQVNQFGPTNGRPVVLVHGLIWGPYVTPSILRLLHSKNINLIAPFRAGFGGSSPPKSWSDFDITVVDDYIEIIRQFCTSKPVVVAHQGGTSHGCRIAAQLGDQAAGLMILSGGVPIEDVLHLEHMNVMTRIGAVACRYAPSIMETVMRAGIHVWRQRGPEKFLEQILSNSSADIATLKDVECRTVMVQGALNMISQGSKTSVHDGMAAMAKWTTDYDAVRCQIKWLHGADDPVIAPKSIEYFLKNRQPVDLTVIEGAGVSLLYSHPEKFLKTLLKFSVFNP